MRKFSHTQKLPPRLYKFFQLISIMGESQSRYSIVERLTQRKLNIISQKLELAEDLKKIRYYEF